MDDFREDLEAGNQFQDYLACKLLKYGIVLNNFCSSAYQMKYGENTSGIEIKYDRRFRDTGNLFFEIEAVGKSDTMIPGGVNKEDRAWLFIVGDEQDIYIFSKSQLRQLATQEGLERYHITVKPHLNKDGKVMSYGMVFPIERALANNWCIRHICLK